MRTVGILPDDCCSFAYLGRWTVGEAVEEVVGLKEDFLPGLGFGMLVDCAASWRLEWRDVSAWLGLLLLLLHFGYSLATRVVDLSFS